MSHLPTHAAGVAILALAAAMRMKRMTVQTKETTMMMQ
jgi:hypothetical protein